MNAEIANICLDIKQYFASSYPYAAGVAADPIRILADNVIRLMRERGDTQGSVAERGSISKRAVGYLVTYGKSHDTAPTLRTVEGLARAFKVPPWALLVPDVPLDLLSEHSLERLMLHYLKLPAEGKQNVLRVAESEARYAALGVGSDVKTGTESR